MIIEGLMGHFHEDVIGEMRGNIRAPEPRRFNQELIDLHDDPFPGADVVQPPTGPQDNLRFHKVKRKTGAAKGGDGRRLDDQLRRLREYYRSEVYYDALIGNTLRGHRSMPGVLASEPEAVILVGDAAFRELTHSPIGPQLLLRVYQSAFSEAVRVTGYRIDVMASAIVSTFQQRAASAGESYLEMLLSESISSNAAEQDSRTYQPPTRNFRRACTHEQRWPCAKHPSSTPANMPRAAPAHVANNGPSAPLELSPPRAAVIPRTAIRKLERVRAEGGCHVIQDE